jgi:hypothetical protein
LFGLLPEEKKYAYEVPRPSSKLTDRAASVTCDSEWDS